MAEQETTEASIVYDYGFALWPHNGGWARMTGGCKTVPGPREVFRMMQHRLEVALTPKQFGDLREELFRFGFEMHEISRRPHFDEEPIT